MKKTQNVFAITGITIQIENQVQPNKYNAPVIVQGVNLVVDELGKVVYEAADMERPMGNMDFSPEVLQTINLQLNKLGLEVQKLNLDE